MENEWKAANVSPFFKSGDKTSVHNYRPISILPVVAKVFEKLVHQQFVCTSRSIKFCTKLNLVSDQATPPRYVIVASVDDWRRGLDNNHLVAVVLVDLSKAFDSVNHDLLCCKMD